MSGPKIAVVVVAAVVVSLVALLATSSNDPDRVTASPLINHQAPSITGTDTEGRPVDLAKYRGQWVVVNFFGTWCPPCVAEHPELLRFDQIHRGVGDASIVSVAYNEDPAIVRAFFQSNGGTWPVVAEGRESFALAYGVVKLPETFLISPEGVVVMKFSAAVTAAELDAALISEQSKDPADAPSNSTVTIPTGAGS